MPGIVWHRQRVEQGELRASQEYCRELTRREAANFYWGFVALPREQRVAIYALYSFARQVDDDVDLAIAGPGTFQKQRDRLIEGLAGEIDDPVMQVLADVVPRYQIPATDLEGLIDGVEMDLQVQRYQSWDLLRRYCDLVASTVGRMCVRVFGFKHPNALEYADDLGVAMQLSNILRDVREDLDRGHIYVPQDELRRFGVDEADLLAGTPGRGWEPLVQHQIERARQFFAGGLKVTDEIPRRAGVCVLTMAGIYQSILDEIENDPYLPLKRRASLRRRTKLSVMLRSWLQAM
ncbi:MAG: phytoene/squalene synthase family protein [Chloroflexota bacterium]